MTPVILLAPPYFEGGNERMLTKELKTVITNPTYVIPAQLLVQKRKTEKFYDVVEWMQHQADMVSSYADLARKLPKRVIVLAVDFWCPGLEQIAMINTELGIAAKYIGWLHGATFVDGDLLSPDYGYPTLIPWYMERTWLRIYDEIWHTSEFFIENLPRDFIGSTQVVREPFDPNYYIQQVEDIIDNKRDYDIVVTGRMSDDRDIYSTLEILHGYLQQNNDAKVRILALNSAPIVEKFASDWPTNVHLQVGALNEEDYLKALANCRVILSAARQEGWGYSIMKAICCGCFPVLADQAVYPELYTGFAALFFTTDKAINILTQIKDRPFYPTKYVKFARENLCFQLPEMTL